MPEVSSRGAGSMGRCIVVVSVVSWMGIAENQLMFATHWSPVLLARTERLDPAVGFLLVLIAAILLYTAVVPGRRIGGSG
jgi:hypothetical protein